MKSDREFLDGIYIKAEKLMNEQNTSLENKSEFQSKSWNSYRKWTPVLAVCFLLIVAIPVYFTVNPIQNKQNKPEEDSISSRGAATAPMTADLPEAAVQQENAAFAMAEIQIAGEITAIVEDEAATYLLIKVTEIMTGFAPDTILIKCDHTVLNENNITAAIGGKGKFTMEEQLKDEFQKEYKNRTKSQSNKDSEEKIENAIQASESGNGFIGYFKLKSIGDYHGI